MSRPCSFSFMTSLLAAWFCVSYLQFPVAHSRSVDVKVQHTIATPGKFDFGTFSTDPAAGVDDTRRSRGMSEVLRSRRLHMPLRSRSSIVPKFLRSRGRKMLFGTRGGCASQDLTLIQGPVSSTSGIPTFSVQIINLCGNCALGAIHVACGNWASATPVDPYIFTRLSYNDCLVNNGLRSIKVFTGYIPVFDWDLALRRHSRRRQRNSHPVQGVCSHYYILGLQWGENGGLIHADSSSGSTVHTKLPAYVVSSLCMVVKVSTKEV